MSVIPVDDDRGPTPPEAFLVEVTPAEVRQALGESPDRAGLSYDRLAALAADDGFENEYQRRVWHAVRGLNGLIHPS